MDFTELPNEVVEDYSFDSMDRLVQMRQLQSDDNNLDLSDNVPRAIYNYNYDPDRNASTANPTDSKRYGLAETFYFDTDNNPSTPGVAKSTLYAWDYDNAGRLIRETIDHWDDDADRTETFVMDLVGNRLERNVDYASPSAVDQFFQYQYDANDRLLEETQDNSDTGIGIDQVTTYDWGITPEDPDGTTQQLSKTVTDGSIASISKQKFVYNLQGRLSQVISESFSNGEVTSRSQVQYEYNPSGIRIKATEATDTNLNGVFESVEQTSTTEYLIDAHNHTGYAQTVVETTKNAAGKVTKRITYVFGQDEITQTTTVIDPANSSTVVSTVTHTFGHDGHGSVRVFFEAAAAIAQVYTYTAYGELLTLHNSSAISSPHATRLTQLGYSGEAFDPRIGQQYLRARYYNPSTGRFNRLDPYAGNQTNPFSYHKYAYVHGDPVQGSDPSGLFSLGGMIGSLGISSNLRSTNQSTQLGIAATYFPTFTRGAIWAAQAIRNNIGRWIVNWFFPTGIGNIITLNYGATTTFGIWATRTFGTFLLRATLTAAFGHFGRSIIETNIPSVVRELRALASVSHRVLNRFAFLPGLPEISARDQILEFANKLEQFANDAIYNSRYIKPIGWGQLGGAGTVGAGLHTVVQAHATFAMVSGMLSQQITKSVERLPAPYKNDFYGRLGVTGIHDIQIEPDYDGVLWRGYMGSLNPEDEIRTLRFALLSIEAGNFDGAKTDLLNAFRGLGKYGTITVNGSIGIDASIVM